MSSMRAASRRHGRCPARRKRRERRRRCRPTGRRRPVPVLQLAFYISGHGFGHASRQIEIINAVARRAPDAGILIRSSAPKRLFERTVRAAYELDPGAADVGVLQVDSLQPDEDATVDHAREFYSTFD